MASLDDTFLKRLEYWAQVARGVAGAESREAPGSASYLGTLRFAPVTQWPARPAWTSHRDYSPGDDFRRVDWRICARHDELLTRRAGDVPDGRLYVFVDCSQSMSLGQPAKLDVARQIAAAVGYLALDRLDQVSVSGFADGMVADSGPLRGRSQVMTLVRFLERLSPRPGGTNLARAAADLVRRGGRPGPVVVVGDLFHPGDLFRGLGILCEHGYGPHLVQVYDAAEASPRMLGEVELQDPETGESLTTTITPRQWLRYRQLFAAYCQSIRTFCNRHRIAYLAIPTNLPRDELLLQATLAPSP
jgi:uncharacterized protein (DUF58 family)